MPPRHKAVSGKTAPVPAAEGGRADPGETRARILQTAEEILRRYGPSKMTVMDVARRLNMSHANVYRHFPSKTALQEAVAEKWLQQVILPLTAIAAGEGNAEERLRRWVGELGERKRAKVQDDPELFATYHALAEQARDVVDRHVVEMHNQLRSIIESGVAQGEFRVRDADAAAHIVLNGTVRFHHPHFVSQSADRHFGTDQIVQLAQTLDVLIAGFRAGAV